MPDLLFASDNAAGVCPEIWDALLRCDRGAALAYGDDAYSATLDATFSAVFERPVFVVPTPTGTAANALATASITPPYGEILCHERAHILQYEGGALELHSGGARLVPLPGRGAKLDAADVERWLTRRGRPAHHHMLPATLSLTQATELGSVYTGEEIGALAVVAHGQGMKVHMDGARFANALVALDATPAELSWRAGVDVLSLGTTKNGTMNAEAVIAFDAATARDLAFRQKRAGFLSSKMRYGAAQLLAIVADDLWLDNARHANDVARRLGAVLEAAGARLLAPVETNQLFVDVPPALAAALAAHDIALLCVGGPGSNTCRLVASFRDDDATVARLAAALASFTPDRKEA